MFNYHQCYRIIEQRHQKAIKPRKLFPTDESVRKGMFLAIQDASKKWTMPIRQALNRFVFMFEEQFTDYM
ncbi:transposase [Vibrio mimicus SX-4]|nr:transposase [Vibrio mimicus SX-4]